MTTLPAGEQHTGTLNLTGEGNEAKSSGISDDAVEAAYQAHLSKTLTTYHQWHGNPHDAMRAALEAAAPAIRQQVAEEIAAKGNEIAEGYQASAVAHRDLSDRETSKGQMHHRTASAFRNKADGAWAVAQAAREIGGTACPCTQYQPHPTHGATWCTCGHQAAHHNAEACTMPRAEQR